jgi:hypothetical protein
MTAATHAIGQTPLNFCQTQEAGLNGPSGCQNRVVGQFGLWRKD